MAPGLVNSVGSGVEKPGEHAHAKIFAIAAAEHRVIEVQSDRNGRQARAGRAAR